MMPRSLFLVALFAIVALPVSSENGPLRRRNLYQVEEDMGQLFKDAEAKVNRELGVGYYPTYDYDEYDGSDKGSKTDKKGKKGDKKGSGKVDKKGKSVSCAEIRVFCHGLLVRVFLTKTLCCCRARKKKRKEKANPTFMNTKSTKRNITPL